MKRRDFLKGMLGLGAASVFPTTLLASEKKPYKGKAPIESGVFYAPYIPVTTNLIHNEDFKKDFNKWTVKDVSHKIKVSPNKLKYCVNGQNIRSHLNALNRNEFDILYIVFDSNAESIENYFPKRILSKKRFDKLSYRIVIWDARNFTINHEGLKDDFARVLQTEVNWV